MFARKVSMHLKPNTVAEYTKKLESDVIPLLRKQNGFQDEISFTAKGLDVAVLAEGVETANQINMLKTTGCEHIQGYAVSRPGPIDAFSAFTGQDIAGLRAA